MAPATQEFFSSTTFAIAGASKDPNKIGNKVSRSDGEKLQELLTALRGSTGNVAGEEEQASSAATTKAMLNAHVRRMELERRERVGYAFCDVVKWYKENGFDAIPIHPKESTVEDLVTVASVFDLQHAKQTSLSIITPPQVSLPILKTSLLELEIPWIWLQPGAEDDDLKEWVESLADEDLKKRVIFGGPCILVEGKKLAKAAGKL